MKNRESNIELLRIILILMVITLHSNNVVMGGALGYVQKGTLSYYFAHIMESVAIIAVDVFVIITGYFSKDKEEIKISKVVKLFLLMAFYGIIISSAIIYLTKIEVNDEIVNQFKLSIYNRWFVIIYIILYLLIPYINKIIKNLSKKNYIILLIIGAFFFYIWPTYINTLTTNDCGYGIINFVYLYLVGAFIGKFYNKNDKKWLILFIYLVSTCITICHCFNDQTVWNYNYIFNLISAVMFFLMFRNLNIKQSKVINKLATFTFPAYIIHGNYFFIRLFNNNIFKIYETANIRFLYFIPRIALDVVTMYIVCIIIEEIRRVIFSKNVDALIEKIPFKVRAD